MSEAGFTGELWRSIEGIYAAILDHPFIRGLTDGSLPRDRFRHYVVQDALYLRDYARALSLAGVRSPDEGALVMFDEHAVGAIKVERSLHESFFRDFGITEEEVRRTPMAPTNLAYTSYLLRVASLGDYHEVLGAVLPCYWIYAEVGRALLERGSPDELYARWIDTYGGEEFNELVRAVLELTDRACAGLNPDQRAAATEAFVTTSRYEWMFWNMGWTLEGWPV
ncbi:transcriptional activator, TenA family [Rubrobacter xylanophilus DSM 9941]|uniref:Aminopyrimidine aminohydrolase n=1 Tax=Rubrobacter xylanophilus (strain DSM 9941 / JCM 11954 / NBRC 16129 / PRD-1) TaxID=266117 RepID=Q1ASD0_RUBXD|nr:thiaminase II [Rubrobacter xylanophilus]ABG05698.1 transcriptional activator, TenA family [Rubrobacter xylanophilus DSM 9941]